MPSFRDGRRYKVVDAGARKASRWLPVQVEYSDDTMLVQALRRGDESAFSWLLDTYHRPLHRTAISFVGSGATADEVVQETWLAVIEGLDRFEGRSALKTWIISILVNKAKTRGVREARSVPFASLAQDDDAPAVAPERFRRADDAYPGHWRASPGHWHASAEVAVHDRETIRVAIGAIAALPPAQQTVIRMRDVEGYSSDEVCAALDVSAANQRVLLHRARSRVRAALEAHLDG